MGTDIMTVGGARRIGCQAIDILPAAPFNSAS